VEGLGLEAEAEAGLEVVEEVQIPVVFPIHSD